MPSIADILEVLGVALAMVVMIVVVRARQRGKAAHDEGYARENVCEHLRPALAHLEAKGHRVLRVGQVGPDFPLEVHVQPVFDPGAVYAELNLAPPVHVSERGVLFCKDDWCELRPVK